MFEIRASAGWFRLRPVSWVRRRCLLPVSSHGCPSLSVCVLIFSSGKDTSHVGLGPTRMTSFNLQHLFKDPLSKCSHRLYCM